MASAIFLHQNKKGDALSEAEIVYRNEFLEST